MAVLVILAGLPGTGKTAIARAFCEDTGAVHLRVDTFENALYRSSLGIIDAADAGYRALYGIAADNLFGNTIVVADTVNPIGLTREGFRRVAAARQARALEVEVRCSDARLHRARVEGRAPDLEGQRLPSWHDVLARQYEPFPRPNLSSMPLVSMRQRPYR